MYRRSLPRRKMPFSLRPTRMQPLVVLLMKSRWVVNHSLTDHAYLIETCAFLICQKGKECHETVYLLACWMCSSILLFVWSLALLSAGTNWKSNRAPQCSTTTSKTFEILSQKQRKRSINTTAEKFGKSNRKRYVHYCGQFVTVQWWFCIHPPNPFTDCIVMHLLFVKYPHYTEYQVEWKAFSQEIHLVSKFHTDLEGSADAGCTKVEWNCNGSLIAVA